MKLPKGKITNIEVSGTITLAHDPASKEFKEAYEGYKETIDPTATVSQMLQHVAFYITRFGINGMVEGVGYVGAANKNAYPYSGIDIVGEHDDFQFEIA